jgi:hypothetical protein
MSFKRKCASFFIDEKTKVFSVFTHVCLKEVVEQRPKEQSVES